MDSDEESQQGSPVSNSPSSPQENASNSDGSDTSDSDSNDSAPNDNSKTTPNAISREHSSSRSSDSSNESFRLASPEMPGEASHDASQDASRDASRDAHEPEERAETPAEVNHGEDHHDELEEDEKHDVEDGEHKEEKEPVEEKKTFDLAHEDLSDVSDVDSGSSLSGNNLQLSPPPKDDEDDVEMMKVTDLREKLNARKKVEEHKDDFGATNGGTGRLTEEKRTDEDALDFEAEDGECADDGKDVVHTKKDDEDEGKVKEREEELEEGEVTDDDDRRPEETEPKPVCRFYARGQCTWGVSCRFLHPGVTDKGNYTMFDMVRPIAGGQPPGLLPGPYERYDRPKPHIPPVHHAMGIPAILPRPSPLADPPGGGESPWERGLRTAKEMLRKANKRKEQDLDFEDKKMNLSTGQDDLDREYYSVDKGSPELSPPAYPRAAAAERFSPPPVAAKYPPRQKHYMEEDAFGRTQRYRELPPHRMPQYEDERRVRPVREVIVQRSEPVRDDEWNDPWMRSKSPAGRGERPRDGGHHRDRSFSSKSYSSSSSSQSESSSDSSRSKSPPMYRKKEKKARSGRTSKGRDSRKVFRRSQSPEKRYSYGRGSVGRAHSPVVSSNKRALERISASQHPLKRRKVSSPKETRKFDRKPPRRSKSSSSGSSDSSASDSDSSGSSSSDSSGRSGGRKRGAPGHRETPSNRHKTTAERPAKPIETKEPPAPVTAKKTTRREELLKQLKAVEDAIARKRSKISS